MYRVFIMILFGFMAILGGGSSIYMLVSIPAIIIWKIYRKVKYGYKLTD